MTSPMDEIDEPGDVVDVLDDPYEGMLLAKNGLNFTTQEKEMESRKENGDLIHEKLFDSINSLISNKKLWISEF